MDHGSPGRFANSLGAPATALVWAASEKDTQVEYLGVTGIVTGRKAPYRVLVPYDYNGTLPLYARGTGSDTLVTTIDDKVAPVADPSSGLPIIGTNPLVSVQRACAVDSDCVRSLKSVDNWLYDT